MADMKKKVREEEPLGRLKQLLLFSPFSQFSPRFMGAVKGLKALHVDWMGECVLGVLHREGEGGVTVVFSHIWVSVWWWKCVHLCVHGECKIYECEVWRSQSEFVQHMSHRNVTSVPSLFSVAHLLCKNSSSCPSTHRPQECCHCSS